jgi:tryptophan synthase alpha chain
MSNRIVQKFATLQTAGKKAFVAYITAGDPAPGTTKDLVLALERAGADIVELGIPFSDPLADGVVNQMAAQRALEAGMTVPKLLEVIQAIRKTSEIPLVLFTYLNPLYSYGLEKFCSDAVRAGVDGLLLLDLPPEEKLTNQPLSLPRIQLIAPTTPPDRIQLIASSAAGFIYYVSREGVTGMQTQIATTVPERVALIRQHAKVPVCVGFGISNPEQARAAADMGDGVVVGSALVKKIEEWGQAPDLVAKMEAFAKSFADKIHA